MNPDQLWETTMNAETRTLLKVQQTNTAAEEIFSTLMGENVESRRKFIRRKRTGSREFGYLICLKKRCSVTSLGCEILTVKRCWKCSQGIHLELLGMYLSGNVFVGRGFSRDVKDPINGALALREVQMWEGSHGGYIKRVPAHNDRYLAEASALHQHGPGKHRCGTDY